MGPTQLLRDADLDRVEMSQRLGVQRHAQWRTTPHLEATYRRTDLLRAPQHPIERPLIIGVEVATDRDQRVLDGGHARAAFGVTAHLVQAANHSLTLGDGRSCVGEV